MTTLGKILVFVHLALSLLFTAIAYGVYMHPLDVKDPDYPFLRVSIDNSTRPEIENPRNGLRLGPGHLSIQGHDPTTDLSFRNLRIGELKK